MAVELKIPEVGESVTEAVVGRWLKSEGDRVEKDEPVVELETDKVDVELPAPAGGVLEEIRVQEGETVAVGEVIGMIREGEEAAAGDEEEEAAPGSQAREDEEAPEEASETGEAAEEEAEAGEAPEDEAREEPEQEAEQEAAAAGEPEPEEAKAEEDQEREAEKQREKERERERETEEDEEEEVPSLEVQPRVMPAARRTLAEHDLGAAEVEGTGPGGRILKEDVLRHVEGAEGDTEGEPAAKRPPAAPAGDRREERQPMSGIRRHIAERLVEAQRRAALLTTFNEIDMGAVMAARRRHGQAFEEAHGVRLGLMPFFVKGVIQALRELPELNAEIDGDEIVYRHYYDIGIAVATDRGLLVPVIRDAQDLDLARIEEAVEDFARRAREKKIEVDELQGGTFTITNGGVFGSLLSTPIVNPPQSGVLGMHAIQERPVARDGEVVVRPMMYVALTYDHRLVDGREAVTFLRRLKELLEDPLRLYLGT